MDQLNESTGGTSVGSEVKQPMVVLARPDIGELEIEHVNRVPRSDFLSMGEMTRKLQRAFGLMLAHRTRRPYPAPASPM